MLDFLTSEAMLTIPDKIEEVNEQALTTIVAQEMFVTALFYQEDHEESSEVLHELEKIDDEADVFKIR